MALYYYTQRQDRRDRFFENAFGLTRASSPSDEPILKPKIDVHEDAAKNLITATFELPGLQKEDINIDAHDNRLTITGESKLSTDHEERGYSVRERQFGKFSRTLRLPRGINESQISASLEDGILKVTFPKVGTETAARKVTIA